jgi:hypothetical protein
VEQATEDISAELVATQEMSTPGWQGVFLGHADVVWIIRGHERTDDPHHD